jgi:RES domain-containing protein
MTGDAWCHGKRSALLVVPSVIVSDERNILINPEHPDASSVTAKTLKKWYFDPRFF